MKISLSLWVCSLSKINQFLPFCPTQTFSEDVMCHHLRPYLGFGEQKPWISSAWRPSPVFTQVLRHLSQNTAKSLNFEEKDVEMLLSVLAHRRDEQTWPEMLHKRSRPSGGGNRPSGGVAPQGVGIAPQEESPLSGGVAWGQRSPAGVPGALPGRCCSPDSRARIPLPSGPCGALTMSGMKAGGAGSCCHLRSSPVPGS